MHFSFPGQPALPEVFQTPFRDSLESYLDLHDPETSLEMLPSDTSTSKIRPKPSPNELPNTPVRRLFANSFRAGNTPPARNLRIRKPAASVTAVGSINSHLEGALEETQTPQTPQTPSFLAGLAWPRPPMRQLYVDTQRPEASWHAVSSVANELLNDETSTTAVRPCHVIVLAQAIDKRTQHLAHVDMRERQPLPPSTVPILADLALQN